MQDGLLEERILEAKSLTQHMHHHTQPIQWAEARNGLCLGWLLCVRPW